MVHGQCRVRVIVLVDTHVTGPEQNTEKLVVVAAVVLMGKDARHVMSMESGTQVIVNSNVDNSATSTVVNAIAMEVMTAYRQAFTFVDQVVAVGAAVAAEVAVVAEVVVVGEVAAAAEAVVAAAVVLVEAVEEEGHASLAKSVENRIHLSNLLRWFEVATNINANVIAMVDMAVERRRRCAMRKVNARVVVDLHRDHQDLPQDQDHLQALDRHQDHRPVDVNNVE